MENYGIFLRKMIEIDVGRGFTPADAQIVGTGLPDCPQKAFYCNTVRTVEDAGPYTAGASDPPYDVVR